MDDLAGVGLGGRIVRGPRGLRTLLERLGPTYIKIGQFLALRPDLIPQEYCDELLGLTDRVHSFAWPQAREILTQELARDPLEVFTHINTVPHGAGALAQTHLARLKSGDEVVIKILRPGIREQVERDLSRLQVLARLLAISGADLIVSPAELVRELRTWLRQEVDLTRELDNLTRLRELAGEKSRDRFPRPYPQWSGPSVLVQEYLEGVPLSDLLAVIRSDREEDRRRVEQLGVDGNHLARSLFHSCLTQIFEYRFFHADLHPGNLLVLPDNRIGFVDFGLCDHLDMKVREGQTRYFAAVFGGDSDEIFNAAMEVLEPGDETDIEAFRREFFEETSVWTARGKEAFKAAKAGGRSPTGQWLVRILRSARRHRLHVPPRILSMYRAILTAESVASRLGDQFDARQVGRDFFAALQIREGLRPMSPEEVQSMALNMVAFMKKSPAQVQQLLTELAEGRFNVNTTVHDSSKKNLMSNRRTRLIASSILALGVAVLLSRQEFPSIFGISLSYPLSAALAGMYLWIFFQWNRLK